MLMNLANGKLAVCLEVSCHSWFLKKLVWLTVYQGGYNFRSISKSALAVTRVLMGEPPDRLTGAQPSESATRTVRQVMSIQASYWRCMFPKPTKHLAWGERLHGMCKTTAHQSISLVSHILQTFFEATSPTSYMKALR